MSIALAALLAFSSTPAQLWAEGVEGIENAVGEMTSDDTSNDAPKSEPGADSPDSRPATDESQVQQDEENEASGSQNTASGTTPQRAPSAAKGTSREATNTSAANTSGANGSTSSRAASAPSLMSLDSDSYIMIQDEQDKDESYSSVEGSLQVGDTLWANAYDYWDWGIDHESGWTYQWLAGDSQSAPDSAYAPIEGATSQSLTITEELAEQLAGKYIRVKVSGDGQELYGPSNSWSTPSSYASDTPGPVLAAGTVSLSRVEMWQDGQKISANDDAVLSPGATIEARAYTGGSSYEGASNGTVVTDGVTFSWELLDSENASSGESLGSGSTVTLNDSEDLLGKYLRVTADGGVGEVTYVKGPIAPAGSQRVARVSILGTDGTSIGYNSAVCVGDTLTAKAVGTGGVPLDEAHLTYQLYIKTDGASDYEPLAGETAKTLDVTDEHLGATFKVEVSGGVNTASSTTSKPVIAPDSAEAAVAALSASNFMPEPVYGTDTNMNAMVEAKLDELGFKDAEVRVTKTGSGKGGAAVSSASDSTNGDIAYYYEDPAGNPAGVANFSVTYEIISGGTTATWTKYVNVRWDQAKLEDALQQLAADELKASDLLVYEGGEADDESGTIDARKDLSLAGYLASWANISWSTSDASVVEADGTVHRLQSEDREATLTATITFDGNHGGTEQVPSVTVDFKVTVKSIDSDPSAEDRISEALDGIVFTYNNGGAEVDPAAVTDIVKLPNARGIGLNSAKITYTMADDGDGAASIHGYTMLVARPEAGFPDVPVTLTMTVTYNGTTVSRDFTFTIKALDTAEIDAELALMDEVAASVFEGIRGDNESASDITGDLQPFQMAYAGEDGEIVWAHIRDEAAGHTGIVPTAIDESYQGEDWRLFRSSNASIITHENLLLQQQPTYNTQVTITLALRSEKFGDLYEQYKDDPNISSEVLARYEQLAYYPVTVTVTVAGTQGENPNPPEELNATVAFVTSDGETIIPASEFSAVDGQTAWDATASVLTRSGYTYQGAGVLCGITAPNGTQWGQTADNWRLFINGKLSDVYASNHYLADGDEVVWVYSADGTDVQLPESGIETNPDAEHPAIDSQWNGYANGGAGAVTDAATPTDEAEASWSRHLFGDGEYGTASDALIIGGKMYLVSATTWPVRNARLEVIDPATGEVESSIDLAGGLDYQCRPAYADGIIVVPLAGGALQALSASTLETIWYVDGIDGAQSLNSLTIADGYVYVPITENASGDGSSAGTIRRVNLYTGAVSGTASTSGGGFYWAGGFATDDYYVVGSTGGEVLVYTSDLSQLVSSVQLSGEIRTALVKAGGYLYAVSNDGVLHKLTLGEDGAIAEVASVQFSSASTSTPTIVDGKAFIGGYTGISVVDVETMQVLYTITTTSDGSSLGNVQSTPLVSVQASGSYAYFTFNGMPGGVYCYKLGDETATVLYTPDEDMQNYGTASVVAGPDGTLYYTNDSGYYIALKAPASEEPEQPGDDEQPLVPVQPGDRPGAGDAGEPAGEGGAANTSGSNPASGATSGAETGETSAAETATSGASGAADAAVVPETRGAEGGAVSTALSAEPEAGGVNTWAVAGVVAGIVGLGVIGAFLAFNKSHGVE